MKKLISLTLFLAAILALLSVNAFAASSETPVFPDVTTNNWFYDDVMTLYEADVISGFPDGTFRPTAKVTTGQALKMILLASGHPEPETVGSHWARGYLNYAIEQGFLVRFQDISDLDITISRGLVAKLASNALGLERESSQTPFTDTNSDFVCALEEAGIVRGYSDGTFRPANALTRAELSAIVRRIYDYRKSLEPEQTEVSDEAGESEIALRTTEECIAFIKKQEGFVKYAMWDYSQYSIGYGTRCDRNEYPNGITEEEANQKLREFIHTYEEKLNQFETENGLSFTDNEYDALISLCYNTGTSWMSGTKLSKGLVNGFTTNDFATAFGIWCHVTENGTTSISNALIARRIREIKIFLYGDYSGTRSDDFCYVIFETEEGSLDVDIAFYLEGSSFYPTHDASSRDYTFLGWMKEDGTMMEDNDIIRENMTLTAVWDMPEESEDDNQDEFDDYFE